MSKYSCAIIQDLLALYHDGVCSEDSRQAVEQHLSECEKCSGMAKLLQNTELESSISEQAGGVLKRHGKKQRRTIVIIISVALIALAAVLFFGVIRPRVELNKLINDYIPEVGKSAEYFTSYDITDESLVTLETEVMSIDIPANYVQKDLGELQSVMYHDSNNADRSVMVITSHTDMSDMNLFCRDNYDDVSDEEYEQIVKYLKNWFGALGNGLPDSSYGTYKCIYLLNDDDRSFWNIGQNIAFGIMGLMKNELPLFGDVVYIYETDDMCGFVYVAMPKEQQDFYRVTADFYSTDDLNTPHTVMIRSETLEEAYSIINSITFE
ncbi:MAG: zf-HC2 domain-containing protein [Oscillospiraceae bacterium]|nr:zf-HC2 domain-containing protein [Oscillospiraceae bacterium]